MSDKDTVIDDTLKVTADDTSVSDTDTNDNADDSVDESDDVEQLKQQNRKLFERAKKAEGFKFVDGKWVKPEKPATKEAPVAKPQVTKTEGDLSAKDIYSLIEAKVPQDDIDEVVKYAKFANISLGEALKSNIVKNILADKAEGRKVADATNTGTVKRGSSKISDEALLAKASKGDLPDDPMDLVTAKWKQKLAK